MNSSMFRSLILMLVLSIAGLPGWGQLAIEALDTDYRIDFDSTVVGVNQSPYNGTGFATIQAAGQLDTDGWRIENPDKPYGVDEGSSQFAQGSFSVPVLAGGIFAFSGGDISGSALGIQPTSTLFTPGTIELKLVNSTEHYITSFSLAYDLYVRNDKDMGNSVAVELAYSDSVSGISSQPEYVFPFSSMSFTSIGPKTIGATFMETSFSENLTGIYIEPGDSLVVRWLFDDDIDSGSGRDEFAIDNIIINVQGAPTVTFYSQNSGVQTDSASSSQNWSTLPSGGESYPIYPLISDADFVIQGGHNVTHDALEPVNQLEIRSLTIEDGGSLVTDGASGRHLTLSSDLICNGQIGDQTDPTKNNIIFNFKAGSPSISGLGDIYCSRIMKSESIDTLGPCDLSIQTDVNLIYASGNCLYNDRNALDGGNNLFNVTIAPSVTVNAAGTVGINGAIPTGPNDAGGHYLIEGTLNVSDHVWLTTSHSTLSSSFTIANGGELNAGHIRADPSGDGEFYLNVQDGGLLKITGTSSVAGTTTWESLSTANNFYDFQTGSTVSYSGTMNQDIEDMPYFHLSLAGDGLKTPTTGTLQIDGDVNIEESSELVGDGVEITVGGSWINYDHTGFDEGTGSVRLLGNGPGNLSLVSTSGGEVFYDLEVVSDTTQMEEEVTVSNILYLDARLKLNSNTLHLLNGSNSITIVDPPTSVEMIISEDHLHLGRIRYVSPAPTSNPLIFPFGTTSGELIESRIQLDPSETVAEVSMATYGTIEDNMPLPDNPIEVMNLNGVNLSPDNSEATLDRYYHIDAMGASQGNLTLGFAASEVPASPYHSLLDLRIQNYDPILNKWQAAQEPQALGPNNDEVELFNSTFGEFAIASTSSPLPVELLTFSGKAFSEGIQLDWRTASEKDNAGFEIQRSNDGEAFETIDFLSGMGNSSSVVSYSSLDKSPIKGLNYYRLRQVDHDGQDDFSEVIGIWWGDDATASIRLIRESEESLRYELPHTIGPHWVSIIDMNGRTVFDRLDHQDSGRISLVGLEYGVYVFRSYSDEEYIEERFVR